MRVVIDIDNKGKVKGLHYVTVLRNVYILRHYDSLVVPLIFKQNVA